MTDDGPSGNSDTQQECRAPTGTYTREVVEAGGDCPQEVVDLYAGSEDVELQAAEAACGRLQASSTDTFELESGESCTIAGTVEAEVVDDGIENGEATVEVECTNGNGCVHRFNVYFTKR
jgi:hypothetical protein